MRLNIPNKDLIVIQQALGHAVDCALEEDNFWTKERFATLLSYQSKIEREINGKTTTKSTREARQATS